MSADATGTLTSARAGNVPSSSRAERFGLAFRRWWPFYLMLTPGIVFFLVFHYLPIWEAQIAFQQVRIIPPNFWVGLKHFEMLFSSPVFWQVLANTVIISAMKMAFVFPVPIIVALLLNELRSARFRQTIQSVLYLPHFLGWVVISAIFIAQLSPSSGGVNDLLRLVGLKPISFMTEPNWIRWVLVVSENWRSAGWDSLLYVAAIIGIDQTLYEAAEIDGANRWQKIWHVTIPGIVPTIATLFILNCGMFLNADLDQVLNMSNAAVIGTIDIIDSYVYRIGLTAGQFSLATAAGLFKAVLGMAMILAAHHLSKRLTGKGVW